MMTIQVFKVAWFENNSKRNKKSNVLVAESGLVISENHDANCYS